MVQFLAGALLVGHGLITTSIGLGSMTKPEAPAMALPAAFNWWPGAFGRSWLFDALGVGGPASILGGALWLVAGLALVGAGLGWLGVAQLSGAWQQLAVVGAALGLAAVALYFHPLYAAALLINLVIVARVSGVLSAA